MIICDSVYHKQAQSGQTIGQLNLLMTVFGHTQEQSENITMEIHNDGSSVVAVLPFELAEQKGLEVQTMARNQGYPLQVKIEAD